MTALFFLYVVGSTLFALALFLTNQRSTATILITLRIILAAALFLSAPLRVVIGLMVTAPLMMEISIYNPYPRNLAIGIGTSIAVAAAGFLSDIDIGGAGSTEQITLLGEQFSSYLVVLTLLSVGFSLLVRHREQVIKLQKENLRLDNAVSKLATANLGYQQYANKAEQKSMIEERKRITREIHDTIGYMMTNNIMLMEAASDMVRRNPDGVAELMNTARRSAEEGLDEIRNALHLLRAQEMPHENGITTITRLVRIFQLATSVRTELHLGNTPRNLKAETGNILYRLIQEGLTNSFRHGKATRVRIILWVTDSHLKVSIWDNGSGAENLTQGIGLTGMQERLEKVSGEFRTENRIDGFEVTARIPLDTVDTVKP